MPTQKGFAAIIIVLIVAVIVVGGYLMLRTPALVVDNILASPTATTLPSTSWTPGPSISPANIEAKLENWQLYKDISKEDNISDLYCGDKNDEYGNYDRLASAGSQKELELGYDFSIYSMPNYLKWDNQKLLGWDEWQKCDGAGVWEPLYVYPDKILWFMGCGGASSDSCGDTETIVRQFFAKKAMAGWKTETFSKAGIVLSYPKTWIVREGEDGVISLGSSKLSENEMIIGVVQISASQRVSEVKKEIARFAAAHLISEKPIIVDGISGTEIRASFPEAGVDQMVYVVLPNFSITYGNYGPEFDQVVKNIKFTK